MIKLSKCVFVQEEIPVLGDFVGRNGVRIDPDKVAVIRSWPAPRKVKDLKSFLGTIVYCAKFLKNYGRLVAPLQKALAGKRKNDPVQLTVDQLSCFERLKEAMLSAPVLAIADFTKPFGLRTDACDYALGGVLFQLDAQGREQPVAYTGRKFSAAELKYPVREKELLAVIHALQVWRPYLIDQPVRVETDHQSLEGIFTQRRCSQRLARWLNTLSEFRPVFKWIPGVNNDVADGISRHPNFEPEQRASFVDMQTLLRSFLEADHADEVETTDGLYFGNGDIAELFCYTMSERDIASSCRKRYPTDPEFATIWQGFQDGRDDAVANQEVKDAEEAEVVAHHEGYKLEDGLIWKIEESRWKLCIPEDEELRLKIAFSEHDTLSKGHPGTKKTIAFMKRHYYWKGMDKFVRKYVSTCEKCQRNKHRQSRAPGRLNSLPVPEARWNDITMDFIVDLPESDGFNSIWVIVDRLSKRSHFIPVTMGEGNSSAENCAKLFCREFVRLHGIPETIVSDRDSRFNSSFWKTLMELLQIQHHMSSAFRPNTDGQSERMNRFIEDYLRNYVHPCQSDWSQYLYAAEFAYNSRVHESIGMTPFEADIGFIPKSVSDHVYSKILKKSNKSEAFEFGKALQIILERVQVNLKEAQARMKMYYDRGRPVQEFVAGDLVMISTKNIAVENLGVIGSRKLAPIWIGPYRVVKRTTPDTYCLKLPVGLKLHTEFHTSLLKPYQKDERASRINKPNEGMIAASGHEDSYLVEAIVGHKKSRHGVRFLVKWLGYPDEENTWEPVENLIKPVGHLLEDYIKIHKLKRSIWLKVS